MYFDLLLLIFILSLAVIGFVRGFTHQVISLAVLLLILFGAWPLVQVLKTYAWAKPVPHFVLWALCGFTVYIVGYILSACIQRKIHKSPLQATDRWLGALIGSVKAIVVVLLVGVLWQSLPEKIQTALGANDESFIDESKIIGASAGLMNWERLPNIKELKRFKSKLEEQAPRQSKSPQHPWNWPDETDTE